MRKSARRKLREVLRLRAARLKLHRPKLLPLEISGTVFIQSPSASRLKSKRKLS